MYNFNIFPYNDRNNAHWKIIKNLINYATKINNLLLLDIEN